MFPLKDHEYQSGQKTIHLNPVRERYRKADILKEYKRNSMKLLTQEKLVQLH